MYGVSTLTIQQYPLCVLCVHSGGLVCCMYGVITVTIHQYPLCALCVQRKTCLLYVWYVHSDYPPVPTVCIVCAAEDRLLQAVVLEVNSRAVQFKLAPTYTLYMAIRRLLLARAQMGMPAVQHSQMVADFVSKTSKLIQQAIQVSHWILCTCHIELCVFFWTKW